MKITITDREAKELQDIYKTLVSIYDTKDDTGLYGLTNYPNICFISFTNGNMKSKTIRIPKNKEVNKEFIKEKLDNFIGSSFHNLTSTFKKLGIRGNIYYTSFGFSYDCFMKNRQTFDKETQELKTRLNELGIKYINEFSDACWVYRFKISQAKENLNIIKSL